jgi:ribose/xylose/arabinose/galactoside ABC-type transport system permease subunit
MTDLKITRFIPRTKDPALAILALFILIQVIAITASLLNPDSFRYLSEANITVMLKSIPVLGVIALGVGILMISGEFDLSVGANYTFSGIVMATLVQDGMYVLFAVAIGLALGIGIGLLNGFITMRFAIPSFIVTLGAMLFWQGMTLYYHGATSLRFRPPQFFTNLMAGNLGLLESSFLWYLGFTIIFWAILHHNKLGNHFYAVGGNKEAATAIGINPTRTKMIAFGIAGFTAAFAGILAASRVGSIQPGQGAGLELKAIAACVIGGVALMGGRGSVLGIFLGAALILTIQDILLLLRAPGFYLEIFVGVLIVGAAIFNQTIQKRD